MRKKFQSYEVMHEHNAEGKVYRIHNNFAFILTRNNRLIFVHKNNVLLSNINPKSCFCEALRDKPVVFEIVHDPIANKPSAINLKLATGALIDSLLPTPSMEKHDSPVFLPYSPPRTNNRRSNNDCQHDTNEHFCPDEVTANLNRNNSRSHSSAINFTPENQRNGEQNSCSCDLHPP